PPLLGRAPGAGGNTWLRRLHPPGDEVAQTLARVLAVALLGAEALGGDHQHALRGHPPVAARKQALAHRLRQRWRAGDVEAQLDRRRHLVDVLAAGTRRADETLHDLVFGDSYRRHQPRPPGARFYGLSMTAARDCIRAGMRRGWRPPGKRIRSHE